MSRAPLVSPHAYQASGAVPRGLLAGIAGVLVVVAIAVGWLTGDDRPAPGTPDAQARQQLQKPDAVQNQPRGSVRSVDEAADRARDAAQRSSVVVADSGSDLHEGAHARPVPVPMPMAAMTVPSDDALPLATSLRPSSDDERESGRVARELDARSAEGRIFDAAEGASNGRAAQGAAAGSPAPDEIAIAARRDAISTASLQPPTLLTPEVGASLAQVVGAMQRPQAPDAAQREQDWQSRAAASGIGVALASRPAAGRFVIDEGTVIPAVLTRRISSEAPGVVTAMVSIDVYDSRTARVLLLPKGARLVGRYNTDVAAGQGRMQFAFTRLILPDGSSFDLPGAAGSDAAGAAGLAADVDRHFLRTFGAALLIGVLADRVVRPETVPATGPYGGGLSATGQVLVDTANAELQRNAAIAPTLTVGEGARLNVEVVRDLVFSQPYRMSS